MRGTVVRRVLARGVDRFIPARAGNRRASGMACRPGPVHPRACGEQTSSPSARFIRTGSSPRVRGTGTKSASALPRRRFIPARAGNRPLPTRRRRAAPVHPRACGEQNDRAPRSESRIGSSPRVRGTAPLCCQTAELNRFIPARAGNRRVPPRRGRPRSVHPRACGEQRRL